MKTLLLLVALALSALATTKLPYLQAKVSHSKTHDHRKTAKIYEIVNYTSSMQSSVKYYLSTAQIKELNSTDGFIKLPRTMHDNYYAIGVEADDAKSHYSAVTYFYKYGKPSGVSPTKTTFKEKLLFEIIPNHLPHEHDRYSASNKYDFILHFEGKALKNHRTTLITLNGTKLESETDSEGNFHFTLPNDFKDVKIGKRGTPASLFIISASLQKDDKKYYTTFSNPYHVNPNDYWSSIPEGIAFALLGLLTGLLILWRREGSKKNG